MNDPSARSADVPRIFDLSAALSDAAGPGQPSPPQASIQAIAWSRADASLYVVLSEGWVFRSADDGEHWEEVAEINREHGRLLDPAQQHIDVVVDTVRGSVIIAGRDRRDGVERGVAWRKARGEARFERRVVTEPGWVTGKSGNGTAGYIGMPAAEFVALAPYSSPAHLWTSRDDGKSWERQDLKGMFREHVHEVYLCRSPTPGRPARLWVTGGDDPTGERSGVVTFDGVDARGALVGARHVLRERPGYRLVGLAGDGKHVYVGNESLSGGVLRVLDNAESIGDGDFEYVLGKGRHDYHQFRSMVATADGLFASATDSYAFVGDNLRADSGGYLYLSSDGGASYVERSLGWKWTTGLAFDGKAFWLAGGMGPPGRGAEPSASGLELMRIPRPGAWEPLAGAYAAKALVVDSSVFYRMAGYAAHPEACLMPGERTFRTDLSPYGEITVEVETVGPGVLVVEALAFQNYTLGEDRWRDVLRIELESAGHAVRALSGEAMHGRWYRVRNAGTEPVVVRRLVLAGRRRPDA